MRRGTSHVRRPALQNGDDQVQELVHAGDHGLSATQAGSMRIPIDRDMLIFRISAMRIDRTRQYITHHRVAVPGDMPMLDASSGITDPWCRSVVRPGMVRSREAIDIHDHGLEFHCGRRTDSWDRLQQLHVLIVLGEFLEFLVDPDFDRCSL